MKRRFEGAYPRERRYLPDARAPYATYESQRPVRGRRYMEGADSSSFQHAHMDGLDVALLPSPSELPEEPMVLQEIIVQKNHASAIIGPRGDHVTRIRQETHAKLHVNKTSRPDGNQVVELLGLPDQIERAVELVRHYVHVVDPEAIIELSPTFKTEIEVTPELVGPILGQKGATIKQIKQQSAAHITITNPSPEVATQKISIGGTLQQLQDAYTMIRMILVRKTSQQRPVRAGHEFDPALEYMPPELDGGLIPGSNLGPRPHFTRDAGASSQHFSMPMQQVQHVVTAPPAAVQAPTTYGSAQPQILVLQPDGTYKAAQVVYQMGQSGQVSATPSAPASQPQVITTMPATQTINTSTLDQATLQALLASLTGSHANSSLTVAGAQGGVSMLSLPNTQASGTVSQLQQYQQQQQPQLQQQGQQAAQQPMAQVQYAQQQYAQQAFPQSVQYITNPASQQLTAVAAQQSGYAGTTRWTGAV